MKTGLFSVFLVLMLLGNCFALYKLCTGKQEFFTSYPRLTSTGYTLLRLLPLLNIAALAGLWFLKPWGACLALLFGVLVIGLDIYYGIYYHLYPAVLSTLILLFFIIQHGKELK